MKQGKASYEGVYGTKVEPKPRAVSPEAVAQIGIQLGTHITDRKHELPLPVAPMYPGRGLKAPMVSQRTSNKGSQGKY